MLNYLNLLQHSITVFFWSKEVELLTKSVKKWACWLYSPSVRLHYSGWWDSCLVINSILFQNLIRHIEKYGSLDCEMDQQVVKKIFEWLVCYVWVGLIVFLVKIVNIAMPLSLWQSYSVPSLTELIANDYPIDYLTWFDLDFTIFRVKISGIYL